MKTVVQKFGGTSLNSRETRLQAAAQVKACLESGYAPVVVVSALGRRGEPYATDTLLELLQKEELPVSDRESDLLLSCGEIIAAVLMSGTLQSQGMPARAFTGTQAGIFTSAEFGSACIREIDPVLISETITRGLIPVVAGFQGCTATGEITTLGRGGTDTTAVALAVALQAERVEIYSDVCGIMTADPKLLPEARIITRLAYEEAFELSHQGARVIHPRAVELARAAGLPIHLRSTFQKEGPSTIIHHFHSDRPIIGVVKRDEIAFISIIPNTASDYATGVKVFQLLASRAVSVDFIDIRPDEITFIITRSQLQQVDSLLKENGFQYTLSTEFVMISVVGAGMTGLPGVMTRIVECLRKEGITIHQTTDSHHSISCLIRQPQEKPALLALHKEFDL
ncbi:MAG: aspartate kinase [Candidatus Cloacimonetes bacterium]|nr:aspartate kinase [Candidatus Cloacimonadota bacterium]